MTSARDESIKGIAIMIREKMAGVLLMGEPINTEDADEVLVAAFGLGESMATRQASKQIDALIDDWMSI